MEIKRIARTSRPKSATQRAIEDKVFNLLTTRTSLDDMPEGDEEQSDASSHDGIFENYYFEEEDFGDYLQLGPLELKLLNITGTKMQIHEEEATSKEEMESKLWNPDEWPVTQPMLHGPLLPTVK